MAKKLPRSITQQPLQIVPADDETLVQAREAHASRDDVTGGAWNAAGKAALSGELVKREDELRAALMRGDLVFDLMPEQIDDDVGSDRIGEWLEDEAFATLEDSINANGQDTPIQVMPSSTEWKPGFDDQNRPIVGGARFKLISGRRRLEALRRLKRSVRTVCVAKPNEGEQFDQLHRRFRENAERENLSLYEELLSIGELFQAGVQVEPKLKAREFGKRISVSEAKISKARSVFKHRERIEREFEDPTTLTLHSIDALLPALKTGEPLPDIDGKRQSAKPSSKKEKQPAQTGQSFTRTQIIMGKKIVAKARKGRVTIDLRELPDVDESFLDKVLLFIAQQKR